METMELEIEMIELLQPSETDRGGENAYIYSKASACGLKPFCAARLFAMRQSGGGSSSSGSRSSERRDSRVYNIL
ncbi:hypothetical protein V9T40_002991 [Parthenolecanium corni]|uniref:Uncharacterized protein n=1 Tax=Parthenolecanium corni TaxID=536013 RepID=A0AAN9TQG2_9HEMI